ncbi:MAG TPA: hypothetical protein DDY21_00305 [Candidatus Moranbacteria bacterium]|nr:hypothetical protein [Candidatus Moranbacteria bacterium]
MSKNESTKLNKNQQWKEVAKKLNLWEIRLIEMRNEGLDYNTCRDLLLKEFPRAKKQFSTNESLRSRMYKGGKLNKPAMLYGEIVAEESFLKGQQIIKNLHTRAAMTVGTLLNTSVADNVRLSAANTVLDRNAGRATQTMEIKDNEEMEELRKLVEELSNEDKNSKRLSNRIKSAKS